MQGLIGLVLSEALMPLGRGLAWRPQLIWTFALADAVLALVCLSLLFALILLVRRRHHLLSGRAFWSMASFIKIAGLVHLMAIWTLWDPAWGLSAVVRAAAAVAGVAAAFFLWRELPRLSVEPEAAVPNLGAPAVLPTIAPAEDDARLTALTRERDAALDQLRTQTLQREKAEAALLHSQKLEAVGQLTNGIAHDFNNLLQAVAGNLELISRKPDDADRVVRWSASALDAVERGRSLTSQLLAFSRKYRVDLTSVRLADLLNGVRDLVERAVAPLGHVDLGRVDPALNVQADPLQLELAILNLAFNARDAMPDGGTLTIAAELRSGKVAPTLPEGDYVALTLRDTGAGMSPEVLARAAEPFFTTKGAGKGTGMGLSMAQGVMRDAGGALAIDSAPGKGTVVTLFLRVAAVQPRRAVDDDAKADERVDLTGRTIVLVDDDAQVRGALNEMLSGAGAKVCEAQEGGEGIALVREVQPELLVVDFGMPGMSGAEVVRQVRADRAGLPVLVVTGFSESEPLALETVAGESVAVLRKPFDSQKLLSKVAELIAR